MTVASSVLLWALGAVTVAALPVLAVEAGAMLAVMLVAARLLRPRTAAGVVVLQVAAGVLAHLLRPEAAADAERSLFETAQSALLLVGVAAGAGWYLRHRDAVRWRDTRELVAAVQRRERLDLARELHDVVAHHIGGMVVQAQAAQMVAAVDDEAAARALPAIESAGTGALASMRRMVSTLRDADSPDTYVGDLVPELERLTGGVATLTVDLAEPVPPEIATSVLRVVQESLTNARRHASGAITVEVNGDKTDLRVRVHNATKEGMKPVTYGGGFGLVGMRERVELLGGRFHAGAGDGDWVVEAVIPLHGSGVV